MYQWCKAVGNMVLNLVRRSMAFCTEDMRVNFPLFIRMFRLRCFRASVARVHLLYFVTITSKFVRSVILLLFADINKTRLSYSQTQSFTISFLVSAADSKKYFQRLFFRFRVVNCKSTLAQ